MAVNSIKLEPISDLLKSLKVEPISDSEKSALKSIKLESVSDCENPALNSIKVEPISDLLKSLKSIKVEPISDSEGSALKSKKLKPLSDCVISALDSKKDDPRPISNCKGTALESLKVEYISDCEDSSLESTKDESESDCEDSDGSVELTDDDKNYIEKLMNERYGFKTNTHKDEIKCVLPCHICEKIELSANPESTNKFLDFIFMEHNNDFKFTKEKRRKIIRSLVNEYVEKESKKKEAIKLQDIKAARSKIKHIGAIRRSLSLQHYNRYSATPCKILKPTKIDPPGTKKFVYKNIKHDEISNHHIRKLQWMAEKLISKKSQANNTTHYKIVDTEETPEENKHTGNLDIPHSQCNTGFKSGVRPDSVIRKFGSNENQSDEYKTNPLHILDSTNQYDMSKNTHSKKMNCSQTSRNFVPKYQTNPSLLKQKVESTEKENASAAPPSPVRETKSTNSQVNNVEETQKQWQPPMTDPESPFYIQEDYMIDLYQLGLECEGWNPTQVLYEICQYCRWGKPEFLEGGSLLGGFLCCVRVKGCSFMGRIRGQTKKIARHLASTHFLNHIGFKFSYNIYSPIPQKSIVPFTEQRFVYRGSKNRVLNSQVP